jgi:hypothetical protein
MAPPCCNAGEMAQGDRQHVGRICGSASPSKGTFMKRSTQLSAIVAAAVIAVGAPALMSTAAAADTTWDGAAGDSQHAHVPYDTDEARAAFRAPDTPVQSTPAGLIENTDQARAAAAAQDSMAPVVHAFVQDGPIQNTDDARARRMNAG